MLERLFEGVEWRTIVVGIFPNEMSAATLATKIALRNIEQQALKHYLTMNTLKAVENRTHII
jgi:putative transposase